VLHGAAERAFHTEIVNTPRLYADVQRIAWCQMSLLPIDDDDALRERLLTAERAPFEGWDFSYLQGRMLEDDLPWDFEALVRDALPDAHALLDMDTGGGEKLARQQPLPAVVAATESYPPNVAIARARLEPLGIAVHDVDSGGALPFGDAHFDLITNRHGAYLPSEIARVLEPGGRFLTQQVGSANLRELNESLGADVSGDEWTLSTALQELEAAGLVIARAQEAFPVARFLSVEAIVYLLKAVPWQLPGFTVDGYFDRLRDVDAGIRATGSFDASTHRFLIIAIKPA
jgi:SAM-dependent methyltransferase